MNKAFWEKRYADKNTGWDIGHVSPPLKAYIDQLGRRDLKILVPGAGLGHEVVYLHRQGFTNVYALDFAAQPLQQLKTKIPDFPASHLLQGDFFKLKDGKFDLILEQTFFCALPPGKRPDYVHQIHRLLGANGKLAGLLFDFPLGPDGPPFGGSREEYLGLFEPAFRIRTLERATNSLPQRQGTELFFIFEKE